MVDHVRRRLPAVLMLTLGILTPLAAGSEPPDSEVNPATGNIESVDTTTVAGIQQIRHVTDPGQGAPKISVLLTGGALQDVSPRIAIKAAGHTGITWWRDGLEDAVYLRTRSAAAGSTWSPERRVSEPGESSRNPEIVTDGGSFRIAFEYDAPGGGTGIAVSSIFDDPEPFPTRRPIDSTTWAGDVDVMVHADSGSVWVSWVHDAANVGWSEYDAATDTWSATAFESYAADGVGAARERVRTSVLGH